MKKQAIIIIIAVLVVSLFIFTFINIIGIIDISKYEQKYQNVYNAIKEYNYHSENAVVAELIEDTKNSDCIFKVKDVIYGDIEVDDQFTIYISKLSKNHGSERANSFSSLYNKGKVTIKKHWYRGNMLVDLEVGQTYLILCNFQHDFKGERTYEQVLMLYPDYPFTEEAFVKNEVINAEDYVTAYEYVKYVDKRYGHGSMEW